MVDRWTVPDRHGRRYLRQKPARAVQLLGVLLLLLVLVPAAYGRFVAEPVAAGYRWSGSPIYLVGDSVNGSCEVLPDEGSQRSVRVPRIPRLVPLDGAPLAGGWFDGAATVHCDADGIRVMTGAWSALARTAGYEILLVLVAAVLLGVGHVLRYRPDEDRGVSGAERSRSRKPWYRRL